MIDASVPRSPGWWLSRLLSRLSDKQARIDKLDRYMRGCADLPTAPPGAGRRYLEFQRKANINLAALIVDAVANRLEPTGFRSGPEGDPVVDSLAWHVWQANQLDARAKEFHRSTLALGEAYMIVGAVDDELGVPLITPEDPRQVVTEFDPARPWKTLAGLKLFVDDMSGEDVAVLALADPRGGRAWGFEARASHSSSRMVGGVGAFEWVSAAQLPTTRVPFVRFRNRPTLQGQTIGEFEDVVDHLDRINSQIFDRMMTSAVQAFKQRAIKGLPQRNPATGEDIDYSGMFEPGPDALWQLPPNAEIWESSTLDITPMLTAVSEDLKSLASATSTPLYLFTAEALEGSAVGASASREALVFKARDRQVELGEGHEAVMSLAFEVMGDRRRRDELEMLWAPVSALSLSEQYDAASKAAAAGLPWRDIMAEVLMFTPARVARMEQEPQVQRLLAGTQQAV